LLLHEPTRTPYDLHFTLGGIPVRVHPFFWIVAVVLGAGENTPLLDVVLWIAVVFVSILMHELGHSLAHRYFGWTSHIVLYSFGGVAVRDGAYGHRVDTPQSRMAIYLAGPAAGFIFAAVIALILYLSRLRIEFWLLGRVDLGNGVPISNPNLEQFVRDLFFVNIFWGLVNLLPIYPLDGGQFTRELLTLVRRGDGFRQSLVVSVVAAMAMALFALTRLHSVYTAIFFGYLAYTSYAALQQHSGGGFGGRQRW
jgi:stage IV sporulation protein FB